ncbi:MAG: hypothetical protein IJU77_07545 [Butyrivibrio sp.]|nr:hypothetical protein [Butyrivibrio sp.]
MKNKGFCRFSKELYWGESVKKHSLVKWRLYHGRGQFTIFCIQRPFADSDQLDIVHCAFLKQPYYREHPAYIYGIAGSKKEALDLVVKITEDALAAGYEGRILEYLDSKAEK